MSEANDESSREAATSTDGLCRDHDPAHPYVLTLKGCGHGRLFSEPCVDCEIVGLMNEYTRAVKTVQRVRDRMRQLGRPMPGHNA